MKIRNIILFFFAFASPLALAQTVTLTLNIHNKTQLRAGTEVTCRVGEHIFEKTLKGVEINEKQSFRLGVIKHNCKEDPQIAIACGVKFADQAGVSQHTHVTCQGIKDFIDIGAYLSWNRSNNRYHLTISRH